jgi:hypothetical protein
MLSSAGPLRKTAILEYALDAGWPPSIEFLLAGWWRDGSDGTRTRDLRRDRPSQGKRRPAPNRYKKQRV